MRTAMRLLAMLAGVALMVTSARAGAHVLLENPPGRATEYSNDYPCGFARGKMQTALRGGDRITVVGGGINPHGGYYRIALSLADDQGFEEHVLADHLPEAPKDGKVSFEVVLPKVSCTACTLQLIQINNPDHPIDGANYYGCADVSIQTDGVDPTTPSPTRPDGGTAGGEQSAPGCTAAGSASSGNDALVVLGVLAWVGWRMRGGRRPGR